MTHSLFRRGSLAALLVAVLGFGPLNQVRAGVHYGASQAYGADFFLSYVPSPLLAPILGAGPFLYSSGPTPFTAGVAPVPYSSSANALSLVAPPLGITGLGAGVASNVDGLQGIRFADAAAGVTSVSFGVLPFPLVPPFLTLTLADVSTSASVVGDDEVGLTATGTTTLTGGVLVIPLLGLGPILFSASPAANTTLNPIAGLTIVLNEQVTQSIVLPGFAFARMEVNGVHVTMTNLTVPGVGTFNGQLILAHSEATLIASPEPGALTLAGMGAAGLILWRRRRGKPAIPGSV